MDGPGVKIVDNETTSQASRTTKEGKKYTYKLHVLQQPLRARACGSGAKSSADRRPVDPPPIVELKIFEGEGGDSELRDVTFSMNSNYFLFATLEQARNMAQGRVPQNEKQNLTVLTGTPVAGMVYLDRPSPAGYFIFPDLSVRHEGKYRLSFSLYEELKDAKDEDQNDESPKPIGPEHAHVTHRLEVKSVPFTVYSAKKFPGLTESTSLSRMVAEQGCRVRIRRDVRMRRRDTKGGKEWDGYEDETADIRQRMSATPEIAGYPPQPFMDPIQRPRSGSNASHHSLAPSLSLSRRPSTHDMNQVYHQSSYGTAPHTPQNAYPQPSPYASSSSQQYPQSPYTRHQPSMQPPPPSYHQGASFQPPPPPAAAPQQSYYGYASAVPPPPMPAQYAPAPSAYEAPVHPQRISVDYTAQPPSDVRRSSVQYASLPPPPSQPSYSAPAGQPSYHGQITAQPSYHPPAQSQYTIHHALQASYGSMDGYSSRPTPAEPVQQPTRTTGATTPLSARSAYNDKLPPLNTTLSMISNKQLDSSSPASAVPPSSYYTAPASASMEPHKRGFGQVFNDRHLSQPLRQGARPTTSGYTHSSMPGIYAHVDEDEPEPGPEQQCIRMQYRRADGRRIERDLPPHN